mgnify:CR=1 FL=1
MEIRNQIVDYTEKFLEKIHGDKCFNDIPEKGIGLLEAPISTLSRPIDKTLKLFEENVDKPGLNPASAGHLAYIPGGGIYFSSLGDYLAAVTNRYAGVFYASPGAVRMTNQLIQWMAIKRSIAETLQGFPPVLPALSIKNKSSLRIGCLIVELLPLL